MKRAVKRFGDLRCAGELLRTHIRQRHNSPPCRHKWSFLGIHPSGILVKNNILQREPMRNGKVIHIRPDNSGQVIPQKCIILCASTFPQQSPNHSFPLLLEVLKTTSIYLGIYDGNVLSVVILNFEKMTDAFVVIRPIII